MYCGVSNQISSETSSSSPLQHDGLLRWFHVVSASAALHTTSGNLLHSLRSFAVDRIFSKSPLFFMFGSGKVLSIALALVISLFKVVTRVPLGLPLNPLSDPSK